MADQLRDSCVDRQNKKRKEFRGNPVDRIRVSFYDLDGTRVNDVTRSEANCIAKIKKNQKFYYQDGAGNQQELNIRQVNRLTRKSALPTAPKCPTEPQSCGPPKVQFFGGMGMGAMANAVISPNSNAIIGFDIVNPGFNFLNEPFANLVDECGNGSGAAVKVQTQPYGTSIQSKINSGATRLVVNDLGNVIGYVTNAVGNRGNIVNFAGNVIGNVVDGVAFNNSGVAIGSVANTTGLIGDVVNPSGVVIGTVSGNSVVNSAGSVIGTILGNTAVNPSGVVIGTVSGNSVANSTGSVIGTVVQNIVNSSGVIIGTVSGNTALGNNGDIIGNVVRNVVNPANVTLVDENKGGLEIKNIVVTAPGDGYIAAPNGSLGGNGFVWVNVGEGYVQKEDGTYYVVPSGLEPPNLPPGDIFFPPVPPPDPTNTLSYPVVTEIEEIFVVDPGFGYEPGDTLEVISDDGTSKGAVLEPVINDRGEIAQVKVINPGIGFIDLPEIAVNSPRGYNVKLIPVLRVIPIADIPDPTVIPSGTKLISVVDCVGKIAPKTTFDIVPR